MKLDELKKIIDKIDENKEVYIKLDNDSSVVEKVYEDFDHDRIFICAKDELIMKNKNRDIPVNMKESTIFIDLMLCPSCEGYVEDGDDYCRHCGQKFKEINNED